MGRRVAVEVFQRDGGSSLRISGFFIFSVHLCKLYARTYLHRYTVQGGNGASDPLSSSSSLSLYVIFGTRSK